MEGRGEGVNAPLKRNGAVRSGFLVHVVATLVKYRVSRVENGIWVLNWEEKDWEKGEGSNQWASVCVSVCRKRTTRKS